LLISLQTRLTFVPRFAFAANCRLPKNKDREAIISNVLSLMNLDEWRNVVVGREVDGEGLPKDARKRLTIAIQLVIEPKILFLDEPTTGLSQTEARIVIYSVKRATEHYGLITLATIHQPSKQIWDAFDDVCILVRGGRVAYMGESGESSRTVLGHFESVSGVSPPKGCNPADYCLSIINSIEIVEAETSFQNSDLSRQLVGRIEHDVANLREAPKTDMARANNPIVEIGLLTVRHVIVQWRNPSYCIVRIFSSMIMSLYIGVLFIGDKTVLSGAVLSIGAIFFLVFVLVIPMQAAVVPLVEDRSVLYRETISGTYSRLSYGIGQLLADQPFHILNTFLMWVFFYIIVDFRRTGEEMAYFLLMLYLANWVIQSLGQLFALVSPNEESANGLGGLTVILSVILMGFLITVSAMPSGWQWACKCRRICRVHT
jgi:ABC-type multidrug transport system ATPase subunit